MTLPLQDWPPDDHFKNVFHQHYAAYNQCFDGECADSIRLDGVRNMAACWPDVEGAPDLGKTVVHVQQSYNSI